MEFPSKDATTADIERFTARNIKRESTVILVRYIEEDCRDLRNRIETGKSLPNELSAATRIRIYANELAERGL